MNVVDVPAAASGAWIKESFALFRTQPTAWISLMSCWLLFTVLVFLLIPLAGPALATMLQPGLFAGFAIAARDQEGGKPVVLAHLFAGFRANGRLLFSVGSVALLAELAVLMLLSLLGFPSTIPFDANRMLDVQAYLKLLEGKEWLILLGIVLITLVKGVLWFCPALLAFHQMPVSHALRWSFYAFIANFLPMLLFGIAMSLLFVFAAMPWLLGMLVWMPLYAIAHFASYRQVFRDGNA